MSSKRKTTFVLCLLLCLCALLPGCGGEEASEDSAPPQEERPPFDLLTEDWKEFQETERDGEQWVITGSLEEIGYTPESIADAPEAEVSQGYCYSATEGNTCYFLQEYLTVAEETYLHEYYLTTVDSVSLKTDTVRLTFPEEVLKAAGMPKLMGAMGQHAYIRGIDVTGGKPCVFFQEFGTGWEDPTHYYAFWFCADGKAESIVDLLPAMEQQGVFQSSFRLRDSACFRNGCYYIYGELGTVLVLDEQGAFVTSLSLPAGVEAAFSTCSLPDRRPVFEYTASGQTVLFCQDGGEKRLLYQGKDLGSPLNAPTAVRNLDNTGSIVFVTDSGVLDWDAAGGSCRLLYTGSGINYGDCQEILRNSAGELILFFYNSMTAPHLYKLKSPEGLEQREVRIAGADDNKFIKSCAAEYSRTHPEVMITVETPEGDRDLALAKTVTEVSGGEGPDLFVLRRDELETFHEKEILADLSGVLPEELKDQMFAGAFAYGTLDGKLYGVPYGASVQTLYIRKELWAGDSWTWEDAVRLMEKGGIKLFETGWNCLTPDKTLYGLILRDIGNSGFVDTERGECRFDTEEFRGLLKFCMQCGDASEERFLMPEEEMACEVLEGKALVYPVSGDFYDFSQDMAALDDSFVCIGYPTQGKSGSFIYSDNCIAVNAGTENMDIVSDFIQYALGKKCQQNYQRTGTVRRDVLQECVKDHYKLYGYEDGTAVFQIEPGDVMVLGAKADGSSFLTEYLELMDRTVPGGMEDAIVDIIFEETQAYFSGDKDAETVSDIIQRRVQLYLDERK